jgi:EmrB/QacA subfamily drug resistance transporter
VHHRVTFTVLTAGIAAYALMQSLVVPVLPTLQHALHTSETGVTWVLTANLLSASIFTPILGRIGDIAGRKRIFLFALGALAVGSVVGALATNLAIMLIGRVIQGIGGGVLPLAFGIIRDEFPEDRVAGAVGSAAALTAVGAGLGVVLAGPINEALGYHWLFWLPAIAISAAALVALFVVPESPVRKGGRISVVPALLLSTWLLALLVALSQGPSWGWASARTIGLFLAAAVLLGGWVLAELHAATPLIDMGMMRLPAVWTANLVALLIGVGMYSTFAFIPQFVQTPTSAGYGFGASVTVSGLIMLPSTAASFVVGLCSGRLVNRLGAKSIVVSGSLIAALSVLLLAVLHAEKWQLILATLINGAGLGLTFSAMSAVIVQSVPSEQTGVASGMNANIRTIGGSIGAALMSSIVTSGARNGLPVESGYTHGFFMLTGVMLLAAGAGLAIPAARGRRRAFNPVTDTPHPELAVVPGGTVVGAGPE